MSINIKKYTKDQMAKMVEEAQEKAEEAIAYEKQWRVQVGDLKLQINTLKAKNATLVEQIDQMNGEAINRANEIANLKAGADVLRVQLKNANDTAEAVGKELQRANSENDGLRTKLSDTEATLKKADYEIDFRGAELTVMRDGRYNAEQRADYAEAHPWRNLWAWGKRKLARQE